MMSNAKKFARPRPDKNSLTIEGHVFKDARLYDHPQKGKFIEFLLRSKFVFAQRTTGILKSSYHSFPCRYYRPGDMENRLMGLLKEGRKIAIVGSLETIKRLRHNNEDWNDYEYTVSIAATNVYIGGYSWKESDAIFHAPTEEEMAMMDEVEAVISE